MSVNSIYRSDGRTQRAVDRIAHWQMRLNQRWTVAEIVEEAIEHRKDKTTARWAYTHRINDLIDTRVLKRVL